MVHELGQRLGHGTYFVFWADGDAQAVGQPIGGHLSGDDAAPREEGVGGAGAGFRSIRKPHQHEVGDAGMDAQAERRQAVGEPGPPDLVVGAGRGDVGGVGERRQPPPPRPPH